MTRAALVLAATLACPVPVSAEVLPWTHADHVQDRGPHERSLWQQADELDRALHRAGKVHPDPVLRGYHQGILDRLYPEFHGRLRVALLDAPQINAFALPNGSIYVTSGLVARFENEAQLATVLAHEGAHFVHRHSLQQAERVQNAAAFALVVGMLGVPLVGDIVALSSMFGYSREHEREADRVGYARLVAAGYAPRESIRTFEHLLAEIKAAEIKEPFFFASHPRLEERIESHTELAQNEHGGEIGRERFLDQTAGLRLAALETDLAAFRYRQIILVLTQAEQRETYPPEAAFYLGEAYRLRNGTGDLDNAEREFRALMLKRPEYAPPYRALGLLRLSRGDKVEAGRLLQRYVELAPAAPDRGYVEYYLKELTP